jgi:KamA family protein
MPIVIPQRVTAELTARLASSRLAVWFVVHANHPNELDQSVFDRLTLLIDSGIPVLNQAVLLRGVNDDSATLIELCRRLVDHRVQPYYLHQLDRVRGAAHFEVPVATGMRLMKKLRESLPGYAVPTYVVEEAGKTSKTPVTDLIE